MSFKKSFTFTPFVVTFRVYLPVLFWCCGFLSGAVMGLFANPFSVSLMLRALLVPMSIDGLLASYYLPLLLWVTLAQTKQANLLCVCCYLKALVLAYLVCSFVFCIPHWWLSLLILFSPSICSSILLLLLSMRSRDGGKEAPCVLLFVLVMGLAALDYFLFSPYLISLTM